MVSGTDSSLSDTAKKLSRNIIIKPDKCTKSDLNDILLHNQEPSFLSAFALPPFTADVRKIGKTHGFTIPKNIAKFLQLSPDMEIQLILQKPTGEKRSTPIPTKKELQKAYEKYAYYFKFQEDVTLEDFNFEEVGKSFHIPIYTRLRVNGTSYAFYVAIDVLKIYGFKIGDPAELIIRKV